MKYILKLENQIDELKEQLQDKTYELEDLRDEMRQQEEDYRENYRSIDLHEFYGVSRKDF